MKVYHRFATGGRVFAPECKEIGADQSFAKEADINTIMARFQRTGMLPMAKQAPFWADVSMTPTDLMEAKQVLDDSKKAFFALPSQLRAMFENSPVALLQWLDDPANRTEAEKWGLLPPSEVPKAPSGGEGAHQSAQ